MISRSIRQIDFLISVAIGWIVESPRLSSVEVRIEIDPTGLRISWAKCAETCPIDARRSWRFWFVMLNAVMMVLSLKRLILNI